MEFWPRRKRASPDFQIDKTSRTFYDIPIVPCYNYLGLTLNPQLKLNFQLDYVNKKAREIYSKICPFLSSAEADTRKNLWQIFVMPLIEFLLPLYVNENALHWRKKVQKLVLGTFKLYMGLSKNTPNNLTQTLLGYDFHQRAYFIQEISRSKWLERRRCSPEALSRRNSLE